MSKYIQFLLVIVYSVLAIGAFFIVIDEFGWLHKPLQDSVVLGSVLIWLLFCFSAAWFLTGFFLLFDNVRKPIWEEEQKILRCLEGIQQRTNDNLRYQFMIREEMGMDAFATGYRTIVLSRGLLNELTDPEIKAVMAHELGHLKSRDCVAAMAYFLTNYLPQHTSFILSYSWRGLQKIVRAVSLWTGFLGLAAGIFLLYHFHILKYAGALVFYMILLFLFSKLFRLFWRLNSRYTEYRQDAFAQKLGLGDDLRKALGKMISNTPQKVNFFFILQCDHPFMHNRIRRLEKLEGLRE